MLLPFLSALLAVLFRCLALSLSPPVAVAERRQPAASVLRRRHSASIVRAEQQKSLPRKSARLRAIGLARSPRLAWVALAGSRSKRCGRTGPI